MEMPTTLCDCLMARGWPRGNLINFWRTSEMAKEFASKPKWPTGVAHKLASGSPCLSRACPACGFAGVFPSPCSPIIIYVAPTNPPGQSPAVSARTGTPHNCHFFHFLSEFQWAGSTPDSKPTHDQLISSQFWPPASVCIRHSPVDKTASALANKRNELILFIALSVPSFRSVRTCSPAGLVIWLAPT